MSKHSYSRGVVIKCRWCGVEIYKSKYCSIRCKEHWTNKTRTTQKKLLPVKCKVCGVVFVSKSERFTRLCPVCIRQNWSRVVVVLSKEEGAYMRSIVRGGGTTMSKIRNYVKEILVGYLKRCTKREDGSR